MRFGNYVQMLAGFLLLALGHYFTAAFLPIADCDETYNFVEPIHFLLYGSGMQTWENCPQYGLRSYLFAWVYAWPAVLVRGARALSSVDVYYFLRIFNGRIACLCELFFVYSVSSVFSGKAAMVAFTLLFLNYPVPHAAVSVLPTSFAMCCYFVALGCWMRTRSCTSRSWRLEDAGATATSAPSRRSCQLLVWATVTLVVVACVVGWPFAGLIAVPCGLDLLLRFPRLSVVCLVTSLAAVCSLAYVVDTFYYCTPTLSAWNVVKYNMFGGGGRGPDLYGTEPWFFLLKNLLLNFHIVFLASLAAPLAVLMKRRRGTAVSLGMTRGRLLLYMFPFFLWLAFWTAIPHKEERFLAPAFPFLVLAATVCLTQVFFSSAEGGRAPRRGTTPKSPSITTVTTTTTGGGAAAPAQVRRDLSRGAVPSAASGGGGPHGGTWRSLAGVAVLLLFGVVSLSRAVAVYHFYSGPERMLYDWYPLLQAEAAHQHGDASLAGRADSVTGERASRGPPHAPLTVCVGKEWYRFPSSFFVDHRYARYRFIQTASFHGMLPLPFKSPAPGSSSSGGLLNTPSSDSSAAAAVAREPRAFGTCACPAAGVNDLNKAIPEQYVRNIAEDCDVVFDSLSQDESQSGEEAAELSLHAFPHSMLQLEALRLAVAAEGQPFRPVDQSYGVLDVDHTPMWCRVLYYPFGISDRCARWRRLVLQAKQKLSVED